METALIFALKRIGSGLISVVFVALFRAPKYAEHKNKQRKRFAKLQTGNDFESWYKTTYPDKNNFIEEMVVNAFRPILVVVLISMLDCFSPGLLIWALIIIGVTFPIEYYFGNYWKNKSWYQTLILVVWILSFLIITSSYWYENTYKISKEISIEKGK